MTVLSHFFYTSPQSMGSTITSVGADPRLDSAANMTTSVTDPSTLKAMTVRLLGL